MLSLCDVVAGIADHIIVRQVSQPDLELLCTTTITCGSVEWTTSLNQARGLMFLLNHIKPLFDNPIV